MTHVLRLDSKRKDFMWKLFRSKKGEMTPLRRTEFNRYRKKGGCENLKGKDYANVWRDCQTLNSLGIIKLKKVNKEIRPVARYEKIIFEFPVMPKERLNSRQLIELNQQKF